jgi:hypothetical protein
MGRFIAYVSYTRNEQRKASISWGEVTVPGDAIALVMPVPYAWQ